jgi:hypothetical protein
MFAQSVLKRTAAMRQALPRRSFFGLPEEGVRGKAFLEAEEAKRQHASSTFAIIQSSSHANGACRDGAAVAQHSSLHRRSAVGCRRRQCLLSREGAFPPFGGASAAL